MPSRITKHYALYMKIFTYPSVLFFTGPSTVGYTYQLNNQGNNSERRALGQTKKPPAQPKPILSRLPQEIVKNASLAVTTAQKAKKYLTAGRVWSMVGPRGEVEVKAAIIYDGTAVAVLHLNPSDGSLLPLGISPVETKVSPQVIENVKRNLPAIVNSLEILNGAEYREPESAWCIPLAYKNMIVAHLKIYVDGTHVVPDYPANQEMQTYGK